MTYNPLVSAIIPTFNRRTMLLEAIDSVLHQTYSPIELIIVDDGSDDGTYEACAGRNDLTYVKINRGKQQTENSRLPKSFGANGVSAARNTGIRHCADRAAPQHQALGRRSAERHARAEFIALLDSDDLWRPAKIEKQIRYFEKNPEAMICQTEEIWIRKGRRVNAKNIHKKYSGEIFNRCLPRCIVSPSAVMFKKALLEKVGMFDETFPVCEDYELWLRVASKFPVALLPNPLTIKRGAHSGDAHSDQLSGQHSLDYYRIRALVKLLGQGQLSDTQKNAAASELKKKRNIFLLGCRKRGNERSYLEIQTLTAPFINCQVVTPA